LVSCSETHKKLFSSNSVTIKLLKNYTAVATESRLKIFFGSKEPWSMPPQVEVWRNIVNLCPLSWSCEIVARVPQDKKIFENWSTLPYLAS
jgi:hypothetical protein